MIAYRSIYYVNISQPVRLLPAGACSLASFRWVYFAVGSFMLHCCGKHISSWKYRAANCGSLFPVGNAVLQSAAAYFRSEKWCCKLQLHISSSQQRAAICSGLLPEGNFVLQFAATKYLYKILPRAVLRCRLTSSLLHFTSDL